MYMVPPGLVCMSEWGMNKREGHREGQREVGKEAHDIGYLGVKE